MLAIKEYSEQADIYNWTDLFLADDKKAGYVAVANEEYKTINCYGLYDRSKLIKDTQAVKDRYISLNAFTVDNWNNLTHARSAENLKQIRVIGIDIDQYNKGLTIPEALDEIYRLIKNDIIPKPNLILTSRGIQIFYSIKGGASPYRSALTSYITAQYIERLKHIGADGNAKDIARLMRVPNSINTRNGASVHPQISNNYSFDLWELRKYTDPYKSETVKRNNIVIPINLETELMTRTNKARIHDFNKLIELRKGDFTNKRNALLYNYAFHLSLLDKDINKVLSKVKTVFSNVTSTDKQGKTFDDTEISLTTVSAFEDAETFIKWYQDNNYKMIYEKNDGIIKPKKTSTLITELDITIGEMHQLKTLVTDEVATMNKRKIERERITNKRRNEGVKTRSEYKEAIKDKKQQQLEQLNFLMNKYPNYTQEQYANLMQVSRSTVSRLSKLLN